METPLLLTLSLLTALLGKSLTLPEQPHKTKPVATVTEAPPTEMEATLLSIAPVVMVVTSK
jgi:hypothetical protein